MRRSTVLHHFLVTTLAALAMISWTTAPARAHPHVWVDYVIEARFNEGGLKGFQHRWVFDDMFSDQIMGMFDADGDGVFSSEEISAIRQGAFEYLQEYDYFIQIKIDGSNFTVRSIQDFHATIEGHQVIYEFFVPCVVKATMDWKTIDMLIADMEYFVDMSFVSPKLVLRGNDHLEVTQTFGSNGSFSFWGGAWTPDHFTLRFRKAR